MKKLGKFIRKLFIFVLVAFAGLIVLVWLFDDEESTSENGDSSGYRQEANSASGSSNGDTNIEDYFDSSIIRHRQVSLKGDGNDTVTILIYVNGSNLESDDGEASEDISEMVAAGTSEKVTTLIQTMGTKKWSSTYGISSKHSQRYKIVNGGIELVDDSLPQLDCTKASTLSDFIKWGVSNYPADRYILQFWNHGAGPVYGFGYDEWQDPEASMSLSQMKKALSDAGVYFDFIGMDCCIMSCLETGLALYDYCDYMVLSEDFESGLGWSYEGWMRALNENSSIDTVSLAQIAIDDNVDANENDFWAGVSACMSLIDESMMKVLYTAWVDFAYNNEQALLEGNYSQRVKRSKRARPVSVSSRYGDEGYYSNFDSDAQLSDYYITDIMAVAQNIESDESKALSAALNSAIVYNRTTESDKHLTGMAVTLPYGDRDFYKSLKTVFTECGIDSTYIAWLEKFVTAEGCAYFYDYDSEWEDWDGWEEYEDDFDWLDWLFYGDDEYWEDDEEWGWDDDSFWCDDSYGCDGYEYYDYPYDDSYGGYDDYYDGYYDDDYDDCYGDYSYDSGCW